MTPAQPLNFASSAQPQKVWPRLWLMSDARNDDGLEGTIARLPRGSGVIFRHYHLTSDARRARLREVAGTTRRHGHVLFVADPPAEVGVRAVHLRSGERRRRPSLPHSAAVHNVREWRAALAQRVDLILLSPIFPTRSHPGGKTIAMALVRRIIAASPCPVILLGGMDARRFARLKPLGAHGWAGISALG